MVLTSKKLDQKFLDVCGSLETNPAFSQVMDVMKRSAGALCTNCTFWILYKDGRPDYCNATEIHFGNPAFATTLARNRTLRSMGIPLTDLKFLEVKERQCLKIYELGVWPLIKVTIELSTREHLIEKSCKGKRVV